MADADFIRRTLDDLGARGLLRHLVAMGSAAGPHVRLGGRTVLQFASNNYLGLAGDPRVKEAARRAIDRWGWGAGASRLVSGHTEAHEALEADLARFMGTGATLVFPTGYMANLGVVAALAGRGDTVVMDRASHASLYDAVRLAGARMVRYPQCDAQAAARSLTVAARIPRHASRPGGMVIPKGDHVSGFGARGAAQGHRSLTVAARKVAARKGATQGAAAGKGARGRAVLATDTVFSMDGSAAPLAALADLCGRQGAMLLVDEAHALGVLGPTGAGLAEELGAAWAVTATVGTLSKALGGVGGFVAARREVIDLIVNRARSFIYTTALPAAACEAARAALDILRAEPERRERLRALSRSLRDRLRQAGLDVPEGETPIVPVVVGEPERALALAAALLEKGIFCPAIRPPTVPPGTSRLRISLTAEHTEEDVERLAGALVEARGETGCAAKSPPR